MSTGRGLAPANESGANRSAVETDPAGLPRCGVMPHYIGPGTPPAVMDEHGCPPGCPRRLTREGRCTHCWEPLTGKPAAHCQWTGAHRVAARILADPDAGLVRELIGAHGCDDEPHARRALALLRERFGPAYAVPRGEVAKALTETRESRESAPRTEEETPARRAVRLDAEAREAGSAYRRALQAADAAWRQIGGRP